MGRKKKAEPVEAQKVKPKRGRPRKEHTPVDDSQPVIQRKTKPQPEPMPEPEAPDLTKTQEPEGKWLTFGPAVQNPNSEPEHQRIKREFVEAVLSQARADLLSRVSAMPENWDTKYLRQYIVEHIARNVQPQGPLKASELRSYNIEISKRPL